MLVARTLHGLVPVLWHTAKAGFNETEAYLCLCQSKKWASANYRSLHMPSKYSKQRLAAFKKQGGRCFYCGSPMWTEDRNKFARKHNITLKYAARFQCTAEHLLARCDGGEDKTNNIVAACRICNSTRHKCKIPPTVSGNLKLSLDGRLENARSSSSFSSKISI